MKEGEVVKTFPSLFGEERKRFERVRISVGEIFEHLLACREESIKVIF